MNLLIVLSLLPPALLLLYPLSAWLRLLLYRKPVLKDRAFVKPVSIIIAAYNEEQVIREKLLSFLDPGEWIAGSEIIVTSTGSTDGTNEILDEFALHPDVTVIISPVQISKITAVNRAAEIARNELLVFSDCRQRMRKGSVKALVSNFNDPGVATAVSVLQDPGKNQRQSFFRRLINYLVWLESQSGSGLNVHGALYAQRRSAFRPFPVNLLFDDLYVIVSTLAQQKRLVQEPEAVIYDVHFESYYQAERLQRLTRGLLIFLVSQRKLLSQLKPGELYRFLVFKYVKLLLPFSMLGLLTAITWQMLVTENNILFISIAGILTGLMVLGTTQKQTRFIVRMNCHFLSAVLKFFLFKRQSNQWEKLKI